GAMVGHQHAGNRLRVAVAESADDSHSGIAFVLARDLVGGHRSRYRHGPVEIVGMRGSEAWNFAPCLRPGSRVFGMRMYHSTDAREMVIEHDVGGKVGGRAQVSLQHFTVQVG